MTIARRLILLLTVPVLILIGLGIFVGVQLNRIEVRNRFVAETQIGSLAALGKISRSFTELRVNVRSYLLVADEAEQTRARALFDEDKAELARCSSIRRQLRLGRPGPKDAGRLPGLEPRMDRRRGQGHVDGGCGPAGRRRRELNGPLAEIGGRLSKASDEWIQHNDALAAEAGQATVAAIEDAQRDLLIAVGCRWLSGILGLLTFRRIVNPIRSLEKTVKSIAGGDYAQAVPFTEAADETGDLARSIDVLKQGAAAMEEQRWVKAGASDAVRRIAGRRRRSPSSASG